MFGEYELRTQFIKLNDVKIHLVEEKDGLFRYRREDVTVVFKKESGRLSIVPAPAEGYGVGILYIDLDGRVLLPPGEEMEFYLSAPVEAIVTVGTAVVDRFNLSREKYALYGTPEVGAIARYWRSEIYKGKPESTGVLKVRTVNKTNEWAELDHLVVYIKDSVMFYSPEKAYYPLIIVEFRESLKGIAEINNTGEPPIDGVKPTKEELPLPNFVMRW